MKVIVQTKNLELTDSLDLYIRKRLSGLKKYFADSEELFIEIQKETKHHRKGDVFMAEASVVLPKKSIMARAHGDDLGKAITTVRDELEQEIKKHKAKIIQTPRRKYRKTKRDVM
jgi:ribosomal subunit interface protein